MTYSSDLLTQARHLAEREPRRPKQASLRRAVSSAYYSLFHLLVADASAMMVSGADMATVRALFQRAFNHSAMKQAARSFAGGTLSTPWSRAIGGHGVSTELQTVARAFDNLQEARHEADYDLTRAFSRREVRGLIDMADHARRCWYAVRRTAEGRTFAVALLVYRQAQRP